MPFKKGEKTRLGKRGYGRPTPRPLTQALISQLNEMEKTRGGQYATSKMHRLVAKLISLGIVEGDVVAIKEIFNRVEGRVVQAHELSSGGEEGAFVIRITKDDEKV